MTVRMRHTPSHTKMRRSHHAIKAGVYIKCKKCGLSVLPHSVCQNCGFYKGREVIDVFKKLNKKEKKQKEKELAENSKS